MKYQPPVSQLNMQFIKK